MYGQVLTSCAMAVVENKLSGYGKLKKKIVTYVTFFSKFYFRLNISINYNIN